MYSGRISSIQGSCGAHQDVYRYVDGFIDHVPAMKLAFAAASDGVEGSVITLRALSLATVLANQLGSCSRQTRLWRGILILCRQAKLTRASAVSYTHLTLPTNREV